EEAAAQMTEMVRAFPAAAPLIGDIIARNLDWPGADEIAKRLQAANPPLREERGGPHGQGSIPPELQQAIANGQQQSAALTQANLALKADKTIEAAKLELERFKAETDRMKVQADIAASAAAATKAAAAANADTKITASFTPPPQ